LHSERSVGRVITNIDQDYGSHNREQPQKSRSYTPLAYFGIGLSRRTVQRGALYEGLDILQCLAGNCDRLVVVWLTGSKTAGPGSP
jgi:hypothetical protein